MWLLNASQSHSENGQEDIPLDFRVWNKFSTCIKYLKDIAVVTNHSKSPVH